MASITINVPDAVAQRVLNGVAYQHGYQNTIAVDGVEVANPETKVVFVKRMIINMLRESVKAYEANKAAETARLASIDDVETKITLS